jgi:hypothetical protein
MNQMLICINRIRLVFQNLTVRGKFTLTPAFKSNPDVIVHGCLPLGFNRRTLKLSYQTNTPARREKPLSTKGLGVYPRLAGRVRRRKSAPH